MLARKVVTTNNHKQDTLNQYFMPRQTLESRILVIQAANGWSSIRYLIANAPAHAVSLTALNNPPRRHGRP